MRALAGIIALGMTAAFPALAAETAAPPGAYACTSCHPASARINTMAPMLIGKQAADIAAAVGDYRSGARPSTVMSRIAKGFTDPEIDAIALWYARQKP